IKNKVTIGNSNEEASKKLVCFKCQGLGHVSKVCLNLTKVTRQEYYSFLMQKMDKLVEQEQELVQEALMNDMSPRISGRNNLNVVQNIQTQFMCQKDHC
ncbi:hypothetical protein RDABS01_036017, partial [Bienertia sinuspersici]